MLHHFLKCCRPHVSSHWEDVLLKNTKSSAKSREVLRFLLKVHLMESVLQIDQRKNEVALLIGKLIFDYA